STWANEFRSGYEYLNAPVYTADCGPGHSPPNYAALGFISGAQPCNPSNAVFGGFPDVTVTGFTGWGFKGFGFTTNRINVYWTYLDNVSYTHGKHLIKFGGQFRPAYFNGN